MQVIHALEEIKRLDVPSLVKEALLQHLLIPFKSKKEADNFWCCYEVTDVTHC